MRTEQEVVPQDRTQLERMAASLRRPLGRLLDEAAAEDALQETWLAALQRPPRDRRNPLGWLRVVARNLALKRRRAEGRRQRREQEAARQAHRDRGRDGGGTPAMYRRLVDALCQLDPGARELVEARYLEGRSSRVIALERGLSRATVDRRLATALACLRRRLGDDEPDDESAIGGAVAAWSTDGAPGARPGPGVTSVGGWGGLAVSTKIALGAAAVLMLGVLLWLPRPSSSPAGGSPASEGVVAPSRGAPWLVGPERAPPGPGPGSSAPLGPASALRPDADAWLGRIEGAHDADEVRSVLLELGGIPPEQCLAVLREIFGRIRHAAVRRHVLDHFAHAGRGSVHTFAPSILALGVRDRDPEVAGFALAASSGYALRPLSLSDGSWEAWIEIAFDRPMAEVLAATAREAAQSLVGLRGDELARALLRARDLHRWQGGTHFGLDTSALAREAGATEWLQTIWNDAREGDGVRTAGLRLLLILESGSETVEREIGPYLRAERDASDELLVDVVPWLARLTDAPIAALLAEGFGHHMPGPEGQGDVWIALAGALAAEGDAAGIPVLIGALDHRPLDPRVVTRIGDALGALAKAGEEARGRDGVWWRAWWFQNRERFGPEVAEIEIPDLR